MPEAQNPLPLRKLGTTGIPIPALSLGSWNTFGSLVQDQRQVQQFVHAAYDYGVRYFDMANNYGNGEAERQMGAALRGLPRESLILGSKVFMPMQADGLRRGVVAKPDSYRHRRQPETHRRRLPGYLILSPLRWRHAFVSVTLSAQVLKELNALFAPGTYRRLRFRAGRLLRRLGRH